MRKRAGEQASAARELGGEVRAAREARGWSTRRLAGRIGTSQPFVSNIENGRIFPSLRTLALLAEALEVPVARLLPEAERIERVPAAIGARPRRAHEPAARQIVGGPERLVAAYRVELAPGEAEPRPHLHDGEDFVLVLDGELVLLREGHPNLGLSAGQNVWVDGGVPHRLAAPASASEPGIALVTVARAGEGAH
jgi:transcriptional regulator with XRE-family HTH domain